MPSLSCWESRIKQSLEEGTRYRDWGGGKHTIWVCVMLLSHHYLVPFVWSLGELFSFLTTLTPFSFLKITLPTLLPPGGFTLFPTTAEPEAEEEVDVLAPASPADRDVRTIWPVTMGTTCFLPLSCFDLKKRKEGRVHWKGKINYPKNRTYKNTTTKIEETILLAQQQNGMH